MIVKIANKHITDLIELISEIQEDTTVPRNVRDRLEFCSKALSEEVEISLKVDKAKHALEEISDDSNLQSYTRTQIWNISSMLEKL